MREYVAGFMLDDAHESVLLINKLKPDWQAGKLNAVGGKVEPTDDSPYMAMVREFHEETLLTSRPGMWELFCRLTGHVDGDPAKPLYRVHFFRACESQLRYQPRQPEDERPEWVLVDDIHRGRRPAISNLRWLIPMAFATSAHDWPYHVEEKSRC